MPFGLLQFAPGAVHCLCQGWPRLWTQLMANLESKADFVVVLSAILVITGEPAVRPASATGAPYGPGDERRSRACPSGGPRPSHRRHG
jgi:hypothetical protein